MRSKREKESLAYVAEAMKLEGKTVRESSSKFDRYDLIINETDALIEVKHRNADASKFLHYAESGFLLEEAKKNFLENVENATLYCNTSIVEKMVVCVMWNIKTMPTPSSTYMNCPRTTDFNNNEVISKQVHFLKLVDATRCYIQEEGREWRRVTPSALKSKVREVGLDAKAEAYSKHFEKPITNNK